MVLKNKKGNFFNNSTNDEEKNVEKVNNLENVIIEDDKSEKVIDDTLENVERKSEDSVNDKITNEVDTEENDKKNNLMIWLTVITGIFVPFIIFFMGKANFNCASDKDSTENKYTIENDETDYIDDTYVTTTPVETDSLPDETKQDDILYGEHTSQAISEKTSSEIDTDESEAYTLDENLKNEKFIVTFDTNGGTPITDIKEVEYGACYGELPTPVKEGYVFAGWYTDETGGIMVTDKSRYRFDRDSTLYAHWRTKDSIIYTVSFDPNGGSCEIKNQEVEYGKAYGSLPTPSKSGSTFRGWHTAASGGSKVNYNSIYNTAGNITLYAHWDINSYTVNFDANGGDCKIDEIDVKYGENYGTLPTPTRNGYNFAGWYTAKSGGIRITSDSIYNTSNDVTLYARWSNAKYTVMFNANGGSCGTDRKEVYYGKEYGTLPTASRSNYTFSGWFTSANGGNKIDSNSIYNNINNVTLYAHWNSIAVSGISISNNPSNNELGVGESVKLKATVSPSNATNQSFTWSSSNEDIATVSSDGTVTGQKAGSVTITAKCGGKTQPVKLSIKNVQYVYDLQKGQIFFDTNLYTPYINENISNNLYIEFMTKDTVKDGQIFASNNGKGSYFFIVIENRKLVIKSYDGQYAPKNEEISYTLNPNTRYSIQLLPWSRWNSQGCDYALKQNGEYVKGTYGGTNGVLNEPGVEVNKFKSNDGGSVIGAISGNCDVNKTDANIYIISVSGTFITAGSNYDVKNINSNIVAGGVKNDGTGKIVLVNPSGVIKLYLD